MMYCEMTDGPPGREDILKPTQQLLDEMNLSLQKDRRLGVLWGFSEQLIERQMDWRRQCYRQLFQEKE